MVFLVTNYRYCIIGIVSAVRYCCKFDKGKEDLNFTLSVTLKKKKEKRKKSITFLIYWYFNDWLAVLEICKIVKSMPYAFPDCCAKSKMALCTFSISIFCFVL